MIPPRRLLYLAHYFRTLDWGQLDRLMRFTLEREGVSRPRQWALMIANALKHNISLLEFYQFGYLHLSPEEKARWAGTGTMYEFQLRANPPAHRGLLSDKRRFYRAYRRFFRHELYALDELKGSPELAEQLLSKHDRLVFKGATGNCGKGVTIIETGGWSVRDLVDFMGAGDHDLVETFIRQHRALDALSPSAVNTVRVFTQIGRRDEYTVLGCRLRLSVSAPVDNLAAGNMAAPIDAESGVVNGPGVFSDVTRQPAATHPVTGTPIAGFQVPFWRETLAMVKEAALLHPENRSVGWDVAITPEGPGLIEGNHDWCKLVWQLPVGEGLKHLLDPEFAR